MQDLLGIRNLGQYYFVEGGYTQMYVALRVIRIGWTYQWKTEMELSHLKRLQWKWKMLDACKAHANTNTLISCIINKNKI